MKKKYFIYICIAAVSILLAAAVQMESNKNEEKRLYLAGFYEQLEQAECEFLKKYIEIMQPTENMSWNETAEYFNVQVPCSHIDELQKKVTKYAETVEELENVDLDHSYRSPNTYIMTLMRLERVKAYSEMTETLDPAQRLKFEDDCNALKYNLKAMDANIKILEERLKNFEYQEYNPEYLTARGYGGAEDVDTVISLDEFCQEREISEIRKKWYADLTKMLRGEFRKE